MKVIKIQGNENRHVQYLYNRVMPILRDYGCGGKFTLPEGDVQMKVCSKPSLLKMRELLDNLKIKFLECEE